MDDFSIASDAKDGVSLLTVSGDLDVLTHQQLRQQIIESSTGHIVVDLRRVDFLDSNGLAVLLGGLKRIRTRGFDMLLVANSTHKPMMKVFEITGLSKIFTITATPEQAFELLRDRTNEAPAAS
jgi:anti-sigma B factor antagonist